MASENRGRTINFRVTESERVRLAQEAAMEGLSLSDYARAKVFSKSTPEVVAATHYLNNSISGLQDAIAQAQSVLGPKGKKP